MSRIDELKAQIAQLDDLQKSGALSAEAAHPARQALEQQLVAAVMQSAASSATPPAGEPQEPPAQRPSRGLMAGLAGFVVVFAAAGYALLGNRAGLRVEPGAGAAQVAAGGASAPITAGQIDAMLERLANRLKERPDDVEGWAMLGRSYSILGRFEEAVPAFRRLVALSPQDAQAHADLADALGSVQGGKLDGEPEQLIAKALQLDGRNLKALALSGSLAFNRGDAAGAVQRWEQALAVAEPGGEMAQQLQSVIAEARQRAGLPPAQASAPSSGAPTAATSAAAASAVQGRITLAAALQARVAPGDTLFVFARPAQGAKMPLAILRKQVKDLPFEFTLDDSLAMSPAARLSSAGQVIVGARISKSGNAMPQPGDLQGLSAPVAVGTRGVQLEIAEVLP